MGSKPQVKAGCVVVRDGIIGAFRVVRVHADQTADIRQFNNSTQTLRGAEYCKVPIAELFIFEVKKED